MDDNLDMDGDVDMDDDIDTDDDDEEFRRSLLELTFELVSADKSKKEGD